MWIYTKQGFISVVQHQDDSNIVVVRARRFDHLRDVLIAGKVDENKQIIKTLNGDYPYRSEITHEEFAKMMSQLANNVTYLNFKNSVVKKTAYEEVLHKTWAISQDMEKRRR